MKNINDILFVIQARLNSHRIPQKMIRDFAGTTLSDISLQKVVDAKEVPNNQVYFCVNEPELIDIGRRYPINIFERSYESANVDCGIDVLFEWYKELPFKYVIMINACSPFLESKTIDDFV